MPRRFKSTALAVMTLVILGLYLPQVAKLPQVPYTGLHLDRTRQTVMRVAEGSPGDGAGILSGDVILKVNGREFDATGLRFDALAAARPGDVLSITLQRENADVKTISVNVLSLPQSEVLRALLLVFVALCYLIIGLIVYWRQQDRLGTLFCLICFASAIFMMSVGPVMLVIGSRPLLVVLGLLYEFGVVMFPAFFLHFFLRFPSMSPAIIRRPILEYLLYVPGMVFFTLSLIVTIAVLITNALAVPGLTLLQLAVLFHLVIYLVLGGASFISSYRRGEAPIPRRRLRGVIWGTVCGILPLVVLTTIVSVAPGATIPGMRYAFLPLVLIPLSFGHAIVRYGLFDMEIVIKRGFVYAILTGLTVAVYYLAAVTFGQWVERSFHVEHSGTLLAVIVIFLVAVVFSLVREHVQRVTDKLFYRDRLVHREVLREFARDVTKIYRLEELRRGLVEKISDSLHASSVALYVREAKEGPFRLQKESLLSSSPSPALEPHSAIITWMMSEERPVRLKLTGYHYPVPLPPKEREFLRGLGGAILVPLMTGGEMLGFVSLGPKRSGERYSYEDVCLLETLAGQAAVALANARLLEEELKHGQLRAELQAAREIQQKMFPTASPLLKIGGVLGRTQPSQSVGGDYFDYFSLPGNRVGFAIADVSGKGFPAALLMSQVRTSFRAEAEKGDSPEEVIRNTNQRVVGTGRTERVADFVTLFYAVLDERSLELAYCNAGHEYPFVVHSSGEISLLENTNLVMGLEPSVTYSGDELQLNPGDVLVFYTDGATEAATEDGSQFGLGRLQEVIREGSNLPLDRLLDRVFGSVEDFAGKHPADDITLVILKIDKKARPGARPQQESEFEPAEAPLSGDTPSE